MSWIIFVSVTTRHTHVALCLTLGQKVAYLEYHRDRLRLV